MDMESEATLEEGKQASLASSDVRLCFEEPQA